jgi:hypothetical protein
MSDVSDESEPHLVAGIFFAGLDVPVRLPSRCSQDTLNDPDRLGGVRVGSYNEEDVR